jgi:hypothetical protein
MLRTGGSALIAAALCAWPAGARAQAAEGPAFVWQRQSGAEACASEDELRQSIVQALGRDPFLGSAGPRVRGSASREGDEYVARLWLREHGSTSEVAREFRTPAANCAPLSKAIVLALALSLDQGRSPAAPAVAEPRPRRAVSAGEVQRDSGPSTARPPGPWTLLGDVEWSLGLVPAPTTGLGIALGYALGERFSAVVGGDYVPPASLQGQFAIGLSAARIGGCALAVRSTNWGIGVCGHARAGALNVKDEAGTTGDAGAHPWLAAAVTGNLRARLTERFVAEAGTGTSIPLRRPVFRTLGCPQVGFQQPVLTLGVFLSGGVLF